MSKKLTPYEIIHTALKSAVDYGPLERGIITPAERDRALEALELVRRRHLLGDFPGWSGTRQGAAMDALAALVSDVEE